MSYGPTPSHTGGLATLHLANAAIFSLPTLRTQVKSLNRIDANEMKLRSKTSDQSDPIHLLCILPQPSLSPPISTPPPSQNQKGISSTESSSLPIDFLSSFYFKNQII